MYEPLLASKKLQGDNNIGQLSPSAKSPKKVNPLANIMGKNLRKQIKNEIKEPVRLPVRIRQDFVEENVRGIQYERPATKYHHIWETENVGRISDINRIFEGIRLPYYQLVNELNYISNGQMTENNGIIYIGCKDGTLKITDSRKFINVEPSEIQETVKMKSFIPHKGDNVMGIKAAGGYLVTLSDYNELAIWDVHGYLDKQNSLPPVKIIKGENISCFDVNYKDEKCILYYCQQNEIKSVYLYDYSDEEANKKEKQEKPEKAVQQYQQPINVGELVAKMFSIYDDNKILFVDRGDNVYLMDIQDSVITEKKLFQQRQIGKKIKFVFYQDGQASIIYLDEQNNQTTFTNVDFSLLQREEEEARKIRQQKQKQEADEKKMSQKMDPEEFRLFKLQQQQTQYMRGDSISTKSQEEKEKDKDNIANIDTAYNIGDCTSISFSSTGQELILSGKQHIQILSGHRWQNALYELKTEYILLKAMFSTDGKNILCLGTDGVLRILDWKTDSQEKVQYFEVDEIQDADGSRDGKYFATLSDNQSKVTLYSYLDCSTIDSFPNMEYTYLMNFSADSSSLVCVQGTETPRLFNVVVIRTNTTEDNKVIAIPCKITEDFPTEVDASISKEEIYMISKTKSSSSLRIYGFDRRCIRTVRDATCLSVSTDEKLLAYATNSKEVLMVYIKPQQNLQRTSSQVLRKSQTRKLADAQVPDRTEEEDKIVNTMQLDDDAISIQFYSKNFKIAIQTPSQILGVDIYTHAILFKVQCSASKFVFTKMEIIFDDFLTYVDTSQQLIVYDINYALQNDFCNLRSKPLKKINLKINKIHEESHNPWGLAGNHLIMQLKDQLLFQCSPYLHHNVRNELVHNGPFELIEGLFVPTLLGGPKLGTGPFGKLFSQAVRKNKVDIEILRLPIYPYKANALHYFAMTSNVAGAQICFENKIPFTQDAFGKTPLDYAIETKDKLIIETVLNGIHNSDNEERTKIMRTLPLSLLVEHTAPVLANMLSQGGSAVPLENMLGQELTLPTLFPLNKPSFAESGLPYYSVEVAHQLHPPKLMKKNRRYRPVSTFVMNNPVPKNFTDQSLKLLNSICQCSNDDIVRSRPITLYLNRKWNTYAYKFYFFQFLLFLFNLISLTMIGSTSYPAIETLCMIISSTINTYFFIFELLQMAIQKFEYFTSQTNITDLARLTTIYLYLWQHYFVDFALPTYLVPIMFMFMWFKILAYLTVFKPTRYLIKMIFEIINDITTFLIILFTALIAYAQICYVIDGDGQIDGQIRDSYVLALGELGEYGDFSLLKFGVFVLFSFFIPLVLLNMLIALMADSYTRVQSNAVAADARALAEMELEVEEVAQFLLKIFKPSQIKQEFYYCFMTQINDDEEEEDWEGTVGQLKRTIEEATGQLELRLVNSVYEITKKTSERIIDNVLKSSKQELDNMESIQKSVDKEHDKTRKTLESKIIDEAQMTKEKFKETNSKVDGGKDQIINVFNQTQSKIDLDLNKVKSEFLKTFQVLEKSQEEMISGFTKTEQNIQNGTDSIKNELKKNNEFSEGQTEIIKGNVATIKEKIEIDNADIKNQLQQTNELVTDTNSSVDYSFSNINSNLNKKLEENFMAQISSQRSQEEQQVSNQREIVNMTKQSYNALNEKMKISHEQQEKLLNIVQELKQVQKKSADNISSSGKELDKKKEFETQQKEAVAKIQKLLKELYGLEKEKDERLAKEREEQKLNEKELQKELSKFSGLQDAIKKVEGQAKSILDNLEQMQQQK